MALAVEDSSDEPIGLDLRVRALVEELNRRIVTFAELAAIGASKQEILRRCWRGTLQRLHDGVYLVGAGPLTWQESILAAVLAGGTTACASHFSALRLWGLGNFSPDPLHVTVAYRTSVTAEGVTMHRTRRTVEQTIVDAVPVVSVEEALLGVAPKLTEKQLHQLLTSAWRRRLTTPKKLVNYLNQYGVGVKGRKKLQPIAQLYVEYARGPGSEAEADFLFEFYEALDAAGIERPELQHVIVVDDGRQRLVPDYVWSRRWKVIEMKGLEAHGNYFVQDEDNDREAMIRTAGYDLECVTPRSLRDRKERTISRLIAFLQTPNTNWPATRE